MKILKLTRIGQEIVENTITKCMFEYDTEKKFFCHQNDTNRHCADMSDAVISKQQHYH